MKKRLLFLGLFLTCVCFSVGCVDWNIALQNNEAGPFQVTTPNPGFKAAILSQIYYLEHSRWPQKLEDLQAVAGRFQLPFDTAPIQACRFKRGPGGGLAMHFHCEIHVKTGDEAWDEDSTVQRDGDRMEIHVQGNVPNPIDAETPGAGVSESLPENSGEPVFMDVKIKAEKDIRADLPAYLAAAYYSLHSTWPTSADDLKETAQTLQLPFQPGEYTDWSFTKGQDGKFAIFYNYQGKNGRMPRNTSLAMDKAGTITVTQAPQAGLSQKKVDFEETMNFDEAGEEADRQLAEQEKNPKRVGLNWLGNLEFQFGGGWLLPNAGSRVSGKYGNGSGANIGLGWGWSDSFSTLLVVDGGSFNSPNPTAPDGQDSFYPSNLELIGKWLPFAGTFRPYLYGGPGVAFNGYTLSFTYDGLQANATDSESDFMVEGGLGLEIQLTPSFKLFAQGGIDEDFVSPAFNRYGVESPLVLFPVMMGIVWGR